jgi:hypothetical protein
MKLTWVQVIPAALLLMALPSFALHKTHHLYGHANIRHASLHGRARARTEHHVKIEAMPSERATEIQSAMIKQGYLTGERALIKLGLGPQEDSVPQTSLNQQ